MFILISIYLNMDPDLKPNNNSKINKLSPTTPQKNQQQQHKTDFKTQSKILAFLIDAPPLDLSKKTTEKSNGCNCRKSRCLKMYCVCFSRGKMCDKTCFCDDCRNKNDNMTRSQAINEIIMKDPYAFSKADERQQDFGVIEDICNCKKSNCMKKYCECFRKGKKCGIECRCTDCENREKERLEGMKVRKRVKRG